MDEYYVSMAEHNRRAYLTGENVRIKKYFYAFRPILAARWVAEKLTVPPMLFEELVDTQLPGELLPSVRKLLEAKLQTSEIGSGERIPQLDAYIEKELDELQKLAEQEENRKNSWEALDAFFRKAVIDYSERLWNTGDDRKRTPGFSNNTTSS